MTRKKKTLTTQDDGATRSPDVDYSDVEADNIEKEGREAIDSNLLLPQPDLKNLEDGIFSNIQQKLVLLKFVNC